MRATKLSKIFLVLPIWLAVSSCSPFSFTIHNVKTCAAAGVLDAGGLCTRMTTADKNVLTFREMVDFLQAQPERECVPVVTEVDPKTGAVTDYMSICSEDQSHGVAMKLPARGAAIAVSSADFKVIANELQIACREAGKHCSYETKTAIQNMLKLAQ